MLADYERQVEQIDPKYLLGQLFWYSFSDIQLPHDVMVRELVKVGITDDLPEAPKDVNVFKRVVTRVKGGFKKEKINSEQGLYEQVRVTDMTDEYSITKRVIVDRVNSSGKKIESLEVADLVFDKETATVVRMPTGTGHEHWKGDQFAADVLDQYDQWRECFDTYNTREWVRHYINNLGAIQVHPNGGTYFVPQNRAPKIDQLDQFAAAISEPGIYGKIMLHPMPLIDAGRQREMVQNAYEAETVQALGEIQDKMTSILSQEGKTISAEQFADIESTWNELDDRTNEYQELLGRQLKTTRGQLTIATKQILQLRSRIKREQDELVGRR